MVASTAIPAPPRTPTPPSDDNDHVQANANGLRQETHNVHSPGKPNYGREDMLSPMSNTFAGSRQSPLRITSPSYSPGVKSPRAFGNITTPVDQRFNSQRKSVMSDRDGLHLNDTENESEPFGFQTVEYTVGRAPAGKSTVGQRRGHKYKHSSVSHQFFLEPPPRPPLQLPASLPTPTMKECWRSMSREQTSRGIWCFCHLFVAGYVQWSAHGSLMLEVLSHLLMFDTLGAFVCAGVDVFGNFEVWKRSSIRHPFGLQRAEVLASFAMSVFLMFMGLDLMSHNLTHALESSGNHEPHNAHPHAECLSCGSVDFAAVAAIGTTLISALILKNHARIGKALRIAYIASLPSVLSNPSHLLTLSCSGAVLLLPLLPSSTRVYLDRALAASFAIAMLGLGVTLTSTLSRILLMSYAGRHSMSGDVDVVIADIRSDPAVRAIDEAKFWQVHYGLCMANLKLRVNGSVDELARLRDRVSSLVKNRLGGGYGSGSAGQRWEVSTQLILEREPWMSGTSAVRGSFVR